MKKILLIITLIVGFWTGFNQSNAEMLDYMSGSTFFSQRYNVSLNNTGAVSNTYTGTMNLTNKLYIKTLDCYFKNFRTGMSDAEIELTLGTNTTLSQHFFKSMERFSTGETIYRTYNINRLYTGAILYFQARTFFDNSNTLNSFASYCYINGTYFTDYLDMATIVNVSSTIPNSSVDTSTGHTVLLSHKNGDIYLDDLYVEFLIVKIVIAILFLTFLLILSYKAFIGKK